MLQGFAPAVVYRGRIETALNLRDWHGAMSVLTRMPTSDVSFVESTRLVVQALREAGLIDESDRVAEEGRIRCPLSAEIWQEWAMNALHRGDYDAAMKRWQAMRAAFVEDASVAAETFRFELLMLHYLGRLEEAEALAPSVRPLLHKLPALWSEHAMTAFRRGDLIAAAERWAAMRETFPEEPEAYSYGVAVLREQARYDEAHAHIRAADDVTRTGFYHFPQSPELRREYMLNALHAGDWAEAARRLERWRACAADELTSNQFGPVFAREVAKGDDQGAPMGEIVARTVRKTDRGLGEILLAFHRGEWNALVSASIRLLGVAPEMAEAYAFGILGLREAGRMDEAEALALAALKALPEAICIHNEHARTALRRGDPVEAAQRWALMIARFPNQVQGYIGRVVALRACAGFAAADFKIREAEDLARRGLQRFPNNLSLWREYVMAALHAGRWQEASRRGDEMLRRFADDWEACRICAIASRQAGDVVRAEQVIEQALRRFPERHDLWIEYANNAEHGGDPSEAARRWLMMRDRFPDVREPYIRATIALRQAGDFVGGEAVAREQQARFPDDDAMHLMGCFESLGDNCEFGLVQRYFGAEPVGLLRWSGILPGRLAVALRNRFENTGDPAYVEIITNDAGDYMIWDRASDSIMHAFVNAESIGQDKFFDLSCRRLRFLREKLVADLDAGEKIFVYKPRYGGISDEEIADLHSAIATYGEVKLLCIRITDESHTDGTVEQRQSGPMIGYIERVSPRANYQDILYQSWLRICQEAVRLAGEQA